MRRAMAAAKRTRQQYPFLPKQQLSSDRQVLAIVPHTVQ